MMTENRIILKFTTIAASSLANIASIIGNKTTEMTVSNSVRISEATILTLL
jgi:hypothetical protein